MATEAILETHIDAEILKQAEAVYARSGMTVERAVRNLLYKAAEENYVPMDSFRPNAETLEAMEDARAGRLETVGSIGELFAEAYADD